jgi:hypothetical protein
VRYLCNILDRLNGANFVVGMHYGYKDSTRSQGAADIVGVDASESINSQVRHRCTDPFEEPAGI